jgi:hypothetical protein
MASTSFPAPQPNNFPDCVFVKLHSQPEGSVQIPGEVDLHLTIRFGEQTIKLPNGVNVVFGLRRGELKLNLSQGRMPLERMGLTAPFQVEIGIEEQFQEGSSREASLSKEVGVKFTGSSSFADKVQYKKYQVWTKGTEIEPVWVFAAQIQDLLLSGSLKQERLGLVKVDGNPCVVAATFEASQQNDIYLIEPESILPKRLNWEMLSLNKQQQIRREFFLRCIAPKLQKPLSQLEHRLA